MSTPSADTVAKSSKAAIKSPIRGITLMVVSTFLFAAMLVVIRHLTDRRHPFEAAFFRSFFGLIFVIPRFIRFGLQPLRTNHLKLRLYRSLVSGVAMFSFFYALSITPIAEVTVPGFAAPFVTTGLAALFLGEVVRLRRVNWTKGRLIPAPAEFGTEIVLKSDLPGGPQRTRLIRSSMPFFCPTSITPNGAKCASCHRAFVEGR